MRNCPSSGTRVAVVGRPGPADRPEREPQHVEHAHLGDDGGEEVGTLGQHGTGQQAAVRTAGQGEVRRIGPARVDQVLGAAIASSNTFCLSAQPAGVVPRRRRTRRRRAGTRPRRRRRPPRRRTGSARTSGVIGTPEPAVAVEPAPGAGRRPARDVRTVDQEHRHARAVGAGDADLLGDQVGVERGREAPVVRSSAATSYARTDARAR